MMSEHDPQRGETWLLHGQPVYILGSDSTSQRHWVREPGGLSRLVPFGTLMPNVHHIGPVGMPSRTIGEHA